MFPTWTNGFLQPLLPDLVVILVDHDARNAGLVGLDSAHALTGRELPDLGRRSSSSRRASSEPRDSAEEAGD